MRQDKDRSGKWLVLHHGDAILKLAGITGFSSWKAVQSETVAPRRLPDGLIEVRFPGEKEPRLMLVEIESYPSSDIDRQIFEDLMLISLDRKVVPQVVLLILKSKGLVRVDGVSERTSADGRTQLRGQWPVVKLWEMDGSELLASDDAGLIPWVALTRSSLPPDELMALCRDRLTRVSDPGDRAGLMVVTEILAGLAFPDKRYSNFFGGARAMLNIESPVWEEAMEILKERAEAEVRAELTARITARVMEEGLAKGLQAGLLEGRQEGRVQTLREVLVATLEARFGSIPNSFEDRIATISEELRLRELQRWAARCPDIPAFTAELEKHV